MEYCNNIRKKIYLAGLLHDIGKFYQRADGNLNGENKLSKYSKKNAPEICTDKKTHLSHQHTIWTNQFFQDNENDVFNRIIEQGETIFHINVWDKENCGEDNLVNLAVNHHKPNSLLQKIITTADWWSAGIDRHEKTDEDDPDNLNSSKIKFKSFKEVPLFSIFNEIKYGKNKNKGKPNVFYKLSELSLDQENIMPDYLTQDKVQSLQKNYAELWERKFIKEFKNLPKDSFRGFEESLLYLLKKYTWAIPSNTMDMANVSLYDHLKTTAAIADCIYCAISDNEYKDSFIEEEKSINFKDKVLPVQLLGVDLSGIQTFIYDIASSRAAKSLKGRSFYLQLLAEAILIKFKDHPDIKISVGHVLFASGGKFYLLLPNTKKVNVAIAEIKFEIEKQMWEDHKGKLSINIDSVSFAYRSKKVNGKYQSYIDLEGQKSGKLNDLWKTLADKLTKQKEQKFKSLITQIYKAFFEPQKVSAISKVCAVTGEELENETDIKYIDGDKEKPVKKIVYEQTELGTVLKDADYLIVFKGEEEESKYLNDRAKAKLNILGTGFYLFDEEEIIKNEADFRLITSADSSSVFIFNRFNFLAAQIKGQKITYGYQFYGGNIQALKEDDDEKAKAFEDLVVYEKNGQKVDSLLGILRVDIDNLGQIFTKGFDEDKMSFSAFSTLSFHLDLFFSGYLNEIRNNPEFKDYVNILYSGGDDVFAVGRWDKIIEFAESIKRRFEIYSGRSDIGLSAGLSFVRKKFPISKAANLAGDAENKSKNFPHYANFDSKEKNAITFFGQTVSWNNEFEIVKKHKNEFLNALGSGMAKALLHKIMLFKDSKDNNKIEYLWNAAYYFKRCRERYKNNEMTLNLITDLQKRIIEGEKVEANISNKRYLDLLALAARWAEYEYKFK